MVEIIDKKFKDWFNRVDLPEKLPELFEATEAEVRREMQRILSLIVSFRQACVS